MSLTRRKFVGTTVTSAAALTVLPNLSLAEGADEAISTYTGGAATSDTGLTLIAPEIAENGNTVQIEVSAPGAEEIVIFADGNPNPNVATFKFGPAAGSQAATTRIRLAGEQDVIAIAKMSDGTFAKAVSNVKVTIGGCGG